MRHNKSGGQTSLSRLVHPLFIIDPAPHPVLTPLNNPSTAMTIPATAHFCWIGPDLPWAYGFAVLSCARQGGLSRVILHHTDDLAPTPVLAALRAAPRVELRRIAPAESALNRPGALTALYQRMPSPAIKSDILRTAILFTEGGLYLDTDTLTLAPLTPLLHTAQFIGTESIIWPHFVRVSRNPLLLARYGALDLARKACRLLPQGWRAFRLVERFCFPGINGAVMGAAPGTALFARALTAMLDMPPLRQSEPNALGPDLLQTLTEQAAPGEITIHPPALFYPLPPEISQHWFRPTRRVRLAAMLPPKTRLVHWYASVRSKPYVAEITPAFVRAHAATQPYSALVLRALPDL